MTPDRGPVLAVASLKGGSGKTTTAVFLAHALASRLAPGRLLLADADPQGSARRWAERCEFPFATVSIHSGVLHREIASRAAAHAACVIDTPPGHVEIAVSALRACDLAIVPLQPSMLDADRIVATIEAAGAARAAGGEFGLRLLLVRTYARTRALREARARLADFGFDLFATDIPQRQSFAMAGGNPVRPRDHGAYDCLADEIAALLPFARDGASP